jgi:hypothetical protein
VQKPQFCILIGVKSRKRGDRRCALQEKTPKGQRAMAEAPAEDTSFDSPPRGSIALGGQFAEPAEPPHRPNPEHSPEEKGAPEAGDVLRWSRTIGRVNELEAGRDCHTRVACMRGRRERWVHSGSLSRECRTVRKLLEAGSAGYDGNHWR